MRTRDKQIILRLTEQEYDELKANVAKTNVSMQAYLRTIIALNARTQKEIDTDAYWKVVKEMESVKGKLLQAMYGD